MIDIALDEKIKCWIHENDSEIIGNWMDLISIPSVKSVAKENAPFGEYCAEALQTAVSYFESDKINTQLYSQEGYAIAEYSDGEKVIGIYAHSDVVPAGDGWIYTQPFTPVIQEGSLIGRGAEDNKSGVMAALCVLKFLEDTNIQTKSKIHVFLGSDEECGMEDLKAYLKRHPVPDISFVPDADFPCSVGEKGIYHFWVKSREKFVDIVDFKGGEAGNIVLDKVSAKIKFSKKLYDEVINRIENDINITALKDEEYIVLTATGIAKHASIPEGSLNAAYVLSSMLSDCAQLNTADRLLMKNVAYLLSDNYAKSIGIDHEDPVFGKTTSVNGICKTESGSLCMSFDVRYGDTLDAVYLENQSEKAVNSFGFDVYNKDNSPGFTIDRNSPVPEKLEGIYNEISGQNLKRVLMSGGTYARKLKNAFSIGTNVVTDDRKDKVLQMPEGHGGVHQRDEKIDINAFFEAVRILIHYVLECDKLINE